MGTDGLISYLDKYHLDLDDEFDDRLKSYPKKKWSSFVNSENQHFISEEALNFLDVCLVYDHVIYIQAERITPREAMQHSYFKPVVDMYRKLETGYEFLRGSPEYLTAQILIRSRNS
jgi:casein kinase II subunit alpha